MPMKEEGKREDRGRPEGFRNIHSEDVARRLVRGHKANDKSAGTVYVNDFLFLCFLGLREYMVAWIVGLSTLGVASACFPAISSRHAVQVLEGGKRSDISTSLTSGGILEGIR